MGRHLQAGGCPDSARADGHRVRAAGVDHQAGAALRRGQLRHRHAVLQGRRLHLLALCQRRRFRQGHPPDREALDRLRGDRREAGRPLQHDVACRPGGSRSGRRPGRSRSCRAPRPKSEPPCCSRISRSTSRSAWTSFWRRRWWRTFTATAGMNWWFPLASGSLRRTTRGASSSGSRTARPVGPGRWPPATWTRTARARCWPTSPAHSSSASMATAASPRADIFQAMLDQCEGHAHGGNVTTVGVWAPSGARNKEVIAWNESLIRVQSGGKVIIEGGKMSHPQGVGRLVNLYPGEPEVMATVGRYGLNLWTAKTDARGAYTNLGLREMPGVDSGECHGLGFVTGVDIPSFKGVVAAIQGGVACYPITSFRPGGGGQGGWKFDTGGVPAVAALVEDLSGDGVPEVLLGRCGRLCERLPPCRRAGAAGQRIHRSAARGHGRDQDRLRPDAAWWSARSSACTFSPATPPAEWVISRSSARGPCPSLPSSAPAARRTAFRRRPGWKRYRSVCEVDRNPQAVWVVGVAAPKQGLGQAMVGVPAPCRLRLARCPVFPRLSQKKFTPNRIPHRACLEFADFRLGFHRTGRWQSHLARRENTYSSNGFASLIAG